MIGTVGGWISAGIRQTIKVAGEEFKKAASEVTPLLSKLASGFDKSVASKNEMSAAKRSLPPPPSLVAQKAPSMGSLGSILEASGGIDSVVEDLKKTPGWESMDPDVRADLIMQTKQQRMYRLVTLLTKTLQAEHDMRMAILKNIRV